MKMDIRQFEIHDRDAVILLWKECGLVVPWNDPARDIQRKLAVGEELFLVGCVDCRIVASVMAGYEGHRGWINYLAVARDFRRMGFASELIARAQELLQKVGCPKINLQVRSANADIIEFYKSIGFKVDDVISLGKRLQEDE